MRRLYLAENAGVLERDLGAFCARSAVHGEIPEGYRAEEMKTGLNECKHGTR